MDHFEAGLRNYFGYQSFRFNQKEIMTTIYKGQDTLAILPTGGGKSVCYQLPALLMEGLTIVVSPLISLMKDQLDTLHQLNIPATYMNSAMTSQEYIEVVQGLKRGQYKLLYLAPERLNHPQLLDIVASLNVSQVAVDEAHCISQWGPDFRPAYRLIHDFIQTIQSKPVISAFTATATDRVRQDIVDQLGLINPAIFVNSFDRPNIHLSVVEPGSKQAVLLTYLKPDQASIIYCQTRKMVDQVYDFLIGHDFEVSKYHGGLSQEERKAHQEAFLFDLKPIMVATNAFGMGIDKTDVRLVIHYQMPTDLEGYYQEAGRAGRDGLAAEAILFFSPADIVSAKFLIEGSGDGSRSDRLQWMIHYARAGRCLRQYILSYFGQDSQPCGHCSVCLNPPRLVDRTKEAQMALSTVARLSFPLGMTMVSQILKGARDKKLLGWGLDKLTTYGLLANWSLKEIKDLLSFLLLDGYLSLSQHKALILTKKSMEVLKGQVSYTMPQLKGQDGAISKKPLDKEVSGKTLEQLTRDLVPEDLALYQALKDKRWQLAQENHLPSYIICSNKTLFDMVIKKPQTAQEFMEVEGIGPAKVDKYWTAFEGLIKNQKRGDT